MQHDVQVGVVLREFADVGVEATSRSLSLYISYNVHRGRSPSMLKKNKPSCGLPSHVMDDFKRERPLPLCDIDDIAHRTFHSSNHFHTCCCARRS